MQTQAATKIDSVTSAGNSPWVSICETTWGYIISSDTQLANRAVLIEQVSALSGLTLLVTALASWLFPGFGGEMTSGTSARVAAFFGLAIPALLFLWISERGMTHEVQVDVVKSCLRLTVCNRKGKCRVLRQMPFDKIASAYIKRGQNVGDAAQLYVRLAGDNTALHIASGREVTLRVLHERLSRELRPMPTQMEGWERVGRRLQPAGHPA